MKNEEGWALKEEIVKQEGDQEADCIIERIDYSKKLPDFAKVPNEVVKLELQNNGLRTCSVNKTKTRELITYVWQYRKHGYLPNHFTCEEDEVLPAAPLHHAPSVR